MTKDSAKTIANVVTNHTINAVIIDAIHEIHPSLDFLIFSSPYSIRYLPYKDSNKYLFTPKIIPLFIFRI